MKSPRLNQKERNYTLFGFLIPFGGMLLTILISALVLKIVYPSRVYSMLYSDCYHQYFPFFKAYRQALLSGDSLLFSWDVGMGLDYLGLISYYLGSPLNLLSVLVPEGLLLQYFTLLTPVKLGFAGMFFAIFLKKVFGKNDISIAIFGSFYGLCAWAMGYQWNVMWVDTFALLPLVALGTVSVLRERKFVLYTLSLFLSVVANYYIGLFSCIFVLLVCVCYEICRFSGFKKLFADIGLMAVFSILAIGMTAFLEIPTLASLAATESSVKETISQSARNIATDDSFGALLDAMRQVAGNMNGGLTPTFKAFEDLPNLYCGIGTNIFAFLFLTCRQVRLRDKLCTVALLLFFNISFIIKQLDYLWHGTHVPNMIPYRFSFLYSFVMLYMAYQAWTVRRRVRLWQTVVAIVPAVAIMMMSNEFLSFWETVGSAEFAQKWNTLFTFWTGSEADWSSLSLLLESFVYVAYNSVFLLLYFAAMFFTFRRPKRPENACREEMQSYFDRLKHRRSWGAMLILGVFCAEQVLNLVNFGVNFFPGINVSAYPKNGEDTAAIVQQISQRDDGLFYRTEVTHTQTLNDGALNGYHGISTFTSSANMAVTNYVRALGLSAQDSWNRYIYEETSPVTNLFLNLKYLIERDGNVETNPYLTHLYNRGSVTLLENNAYLPLGFMTDSALAELEFTSNGNRFRFQNRLLSAALGEEVAAWSIIDGDRLSIASREATLSGTTSSGYTAYKTGSASGSVYYTYTFDTAGLFCVDLSLPNKNSFTFSYEAAGSDYVTLYTETYSLKQMLSVCQVNPGDRIQITVKCGANENGGINIIGAVLNEDVFRRAHNTLAAHTLELTTFRNTFIEGTVVCPRDGLLYTSIPHSGNWQVWVDGAAAEVTLIGGAMTGVFLTEGTHTVTFRYVNESFRLGLGISIGCAGVLLAICFFVYWLPAIKKIGTV